MTTAFVDFNGVVPEKFDAVRLSHLVDAEYGNQGVDFKMVPREGFGWMNGKKLLSTTCMDGHINMSSLAAYQVGLSFLTTHMRRAVAALTSPEVFFGLSSNFDAPLQSTVTVGDPLDLAMDALNMGGNTSSL